MPHSSAGRILACARAAGRTIAVAESLTGGSVCAELVTEPGASDVVKGAVVAYQLEVKRDVLGLPAHVLDTAGPVSAEVAVAMADGVRRVLNADVGVATTGVAGPEWHGDKPPGRVVIAVTGDDFHEVREYDFDGDREAVSEQARDGALDLLLFALQEPGGSARSGGEQD